MVLAQKQTYESMEQNKSPEISQHTFGQFILDKGGKNIQWRKDSLFSSGVGKAGQPHVNR